MKRTKPSGKVDPSTGQSGGLPSVDGQSGGLPSVDVDKAVDIGSFVERQVSFVLSDPHQPDCPIVLASPGFFVTTGYSQEEVLGKNCRFLQGPDTDPEAINQIREAVKEQRECRVEILNYRKNGSKFMNLLHIVPVKQGDQLVFFMGMQLELPAHSVGNSVAEGGEMAKYTELSPSHHHPGHKDEDALPGGEGAEPNPMMTGYRTEHQSLVVTSETLLHGVGKLCSNYVASDPNLPDCPIIFASDGFLELTGYSRDEVIGRNCRFLQGFNTNPATVQKISHAVKNNMNVTAQILNYKKDGTPFWNMLVVSPVWRDDNTVAYFVGVQMDISSNAGQPPRLEENQSLDVDANAVHSMLGEIKVDG